MRFIPDKRDILCSDDLPMAVIPAVPSVLRLEYFPDEIEGQLPQTMALLEFERLRLGNECKWVSESFVVGRYVTATKQLTMFQFGLCACV